MAEAPVRQASTADFTFQVGDKTTEDLKVTGFRGAEEISRLFNFRVELCSDDRAVSFDDIVGKACILEVRGAHGSRFVNGIVRRFERTGEGSSLTYYAAEVVPLHWLLTKRHKSRIFQEHNCSDMTIPGVIKKVLDDAGIPSDNYRFALQGEYDPREYVVQYRESEMNFISRLMEEEGIFFFFEHTADGHKMVIGDGPVAHTETPNTSEFAYRDPTGLVTEQEQEFVWRVRDAQEIQTGAITLDDYNFQQPAVDLAATASADEYTSLEYSDYPGEYTEKSVGDRYAAIRLEEFQCRRRVQQMEATVRALLPGYTFTLKEHESESLNRDYLVTRIVHSARQPQSGQEEAGGQYGIEYKADVRTIPADVPFRPPRVTPRSVIHGTQTALVVGPSGEEIYTDKYGRVKVQYHWDREGTHDENSSRWTRVSQGSAGGQYGIMFLPRVGQEVVVDFIEGDPDRPIITGRVYNNDQMPPYALPGEKTKSCIKTNSSKGGGGTNEIRFEDKKGEEQLLLHAEKDLHIRVTNDAVENVEHDDHLTVDNDRFLKITRDQSVAVGGKESYSVGGTRSISVGGDVVESFDANHKHEVTQTYALKAANIKLEADSEIELKCGGTSVVLTPSALFLVGGPQVNINSGSGAAVSPVTARATSTSDPATADDVQPGQDVTYQQGPEQWAPVEVEPVPTRATESEEEERKSWIRIRLVDEEGQPIPSERYRITCPDGQIKEGTLDANGMAYVGGIDPGNCDITFPNLDRTAWRRKE